jgi:quercetin dioxygenase-like cupin family protein
METPMPTDRWIDMVPGVRRRPTAGGNAMYQMMVEFVAGATTPEHAHVHEQVTYVLAGKMKFTVAGQPRTLSKGEVIYFASNVPHAAEAVEAATLLDTFNPPREDLKKIDKERGFNV